MTEIGDSETLHDWLKDQPVEFGCVFATRIALGVVPVLELALHEDEEDRRRVVILSSFRALAASSFTGAWPRRAGDVRTVARAAGHEAGTAISSLAYGARMGAVEAQEAIPEIDEEVWRLENDACALGVPERAVDAAVEATHSVVAVVDAAEGIGSSAAVHEAVASAARIAQCAIDGIHGGTELFDDPEENESEDGVAPHFEEFWYAVTLDVEWLESGENAEILPEEIVADLSEKALWLGGTPVWANRRWADFKDRLREVEGWQVWIGRYEVRLAGRQLDAALETDLLKIPSAEWRQGPAHVNAIIAKLIESRFDPVLAGKEPVVTVADAGLVASTGYCHIKCGLETLDG